MKIIIGALLALGLGVLLLTAYLGPDDLRACDTASGPKQPASCRAADAIVTVSGGDTYARVDEALVLYRSGWAPKLIFSGAAKDKSGPSNAAAMRSYAINRGIPMDDIFVEEYGATTKQNADLTQAILDEHSIETVILVTSAYHQRRAGLEFRARAASDIEIRNHPVIKDSHWSAFWWATPRGWHLAIGEIVKIVAFYAGQTQ